MTRRRITDIASRKMKDTMQCWSDITDGAATPPATNAPATFTGTLGTETQAVVFSPTARGGPLDKGNDVATIPIGISRHRSTVFYKGFRENIQIQCSTGVPWHWRRIIFETKEFYGNASPPDGEVFRQSTFGDYKRLVSFPASGTLDTIFDLLFQGESGVDWNKPMTAQLDRRQAKIHYDRKRVLNPGSTSGKLWNLKEWHPVNRTLMYNDRELGDRKEYFPYASQGIAGMGNLYVIDLFECATQGGEADELQFSPQCVTYWHEK